MKTTSGQDALTTRVAHTPGPWTAEHDADGDFGIYWGNKHICTTVSDTTEDEANARLIIAAPLMRDLLEAIQFHNRSKIQAWREKYGYDFPDYAETSDMAREAIDLVLTKAERGQ